MGNVIFSDFSRIFAIRAGGSGYSSMHCQGLSVRVRKTFLALLEGEIHHFWVKELGMTLRCRRCAFATSETSVVCRLSYPHFVQPSPAPFSQLFSCKKLFRRRELVNYMHVFQASFQPAQNARYDFFPRCFLCRWRGVA